MKYFFALNFNVMVWSQPARAVWIEISGDGYAGGSDGRSQPARAVWIEISIMKAPPYSKWSQPARAVWIEIFYQGVWLPQLCRHSLRGLCGLKLPKNERKYRRPCHSLRGLCGLKYSLTESDKKGLRSQPARAVWIEILRPYHFWASLIRHSLRGLCGLKFQ